MADFDSLITRAEALISRLEAVLPHPLGAPDWSASIAYRYRKRAGSGWLEPVKHVATIRLNHLREVEPQKERLLRNFGSLKRVSEASFAELIPFVGQRQAERIIEYFARIRETDGREQTKNTL